jgi:hypothetical protein
LPAQDRLLRKNVSRETSGRARLRGRRWRKRFHVKQRARCFAAAGPENAILQNNPMHQKIA